MPPLALLGIVSSVIPDLIKLFGGKDEDPSKAKLVQALVDKLQTDDPEKIKAELNKSEVKDDVQRTLTGVALDELKEKNRAAQAAAEETNRASLADSQEQDRAAEVQRQIDLEFYKEDLSDREKDRQDAYQRELLDFQDRQIARGTITQLAEEGNPIAWVGPILAFVLMGLIFYCLRSILVAQEPIQNRDVFNTVRGALVTAFTTVISFYFGSSASSRRKDRLLEAGVLVTPNVPPGGSGGGGPPGAATLSDAASLPSGPRRLVERPSQSPDSYLGTFAQKAPSIMRDLIRDVGLTVEQAAGILGNIGHECNGFKNYQEVKPSSGPGGYGWCQWTASRRRDFERWAASKKLSISSDEANYGFLVHELNGTEGASLRSLRHQMTVAGATEVFEKEFERAGVAALASRLRFANLAYKSFKEA